MVIIPLVLVGSYAPAYDAERNDFEISYWYSATWFMAMVFELQLVLVRSQVDLAYRIVFGANLLLSLDTIKSLLVVVPSNQLIVQPIYKPECTQVKAEKATPSRRIEWRHVASGVLMLWGLLITGLHASSFRLTYPAMCSSYVRPWLQVKPACILLTVDCASEGIAGLDQEIEDRFNQIDRSIVSYLVLQRCPHLMMPALLQTLHRVIEIDIVDSTLATWPSEAALTSRLHPRLLSLAIVKTNMTELPAGLLHADFPSTLGDIEICDTNLTSLPAQLAEIWNDKYYIYVERSLLTEFPEAMTRVRVSQLSLSENNISSIPVDFLCDRDILELHLSGNPIASLPDDDALGSCSSPPRIGHLGIVDTRIAALPSWVRTSVKTVQAYGSPLCTGGGSTTAGIDCNVASPLKFPLDKTPS
ncbi:hypothetical protein PINS_up005824 [Pythium insidiosum]|nr:hypothetical protein PINS_up005824 [Pythium insidiosum]